MKQLIFKFLLTVRWHSQICLVSSTQPALCSFQNLLLRYLKLVAVFPEHFICYAKEMDLKIESAKFQHKPANKFSQKEVRSIKLKTIF